MSRTEQVDEQQDAEAPDAEQWAVATQQPPSSGDGPRTARRWWRWVAVLAAVAVWVSFLFVVVFPRLEQVFNTDPTLEVDQPAQDDDADDG